jgi:hypothetical protein
MAFLKEETMNKVVAHFTDGRIIHGNTHDFFPGKDIFHLNVANASADAKPIVIYIKDLKALFFVKDFAGDPQHVTVNEFGPSHPPIGRKIRVVFNDGEVLAGSTTGYQPGRPGFVIIPADASSNNERCYIVTASTKEIILM